MASLAEILGQAKQQAVQQVRADIKGAVNQVKQTAAGVLASAKNEVIGQAAAAARSVVNNTLNGAVGAAANTVVGTASSIVNNTLNGAIGAAADVVSSSLDQAAARLFDIPGAAIGAAGSVLGVTSGSTLSSPGGEPFVASSNFGINEGNALYGALARSDPLTSIGWYAQLPVLNSPLGNVGLPWFYVEEANTPFRNFDVTSIFRDGRSRHYAGRYSLDNLSLGIYLDSAGVALNYLQAWQSCILMPTTFENQYTNGGGYMVPNQYKKSIYFYLLDPAKQAVAVLQYVECWPTNIDSLSLDSGSANRLVAQVNFSVGDVFVITTGLSTASINSIISAANPIPRIINEVGGSVIREGQRIVNSAVSSARSAVSSLF